MKRLMNSTISFPRSAWEREPRRSASRCVLLISSAGTRTRRRASKRAFPRGAWERDCRRRGGLALMVVLVALAIISAIGMSLLKSAISQHRQVARDVLVVQSRWLAESGIDRAAALLKTDEKAAGFQWSVPAEQLGGRHAAKVTIEIKPVENAPQRRQIVAATEYPAESPKRIRATVTRFVDF